MKIAQALSGSDAWGEINNETLERGVGGREGALIRLSREWAKLGHEVTNFVPTTTPSRVYDDSGGFFEFVPYKLAMTCMATFEYDSCVAWECPDVFADPRVVERNPIRLVEMQCAHLPGMRKEAAQEFATGIIGLSQWHVDFLAHEGNDGPFYVLPNGVDLEHFPWPKTLTLPRKKRFVYTSSPDRGLIHLLRIWPKVRERWPGAELKVAYGVSNWVAANIWGHSQGGAMAVEIGHRLRQDGVEDVGRLPQSEIARLHRQSSALAYPCDTMSPTETGCITVIEAMAAGKPVVTTNCDCLEEEFSEAAVIVPLPFRDDDYLGALTDVLEDRDTYMALATAGRSFAERRQWRLIAPQWIELFESLR
jgi:glycosyltransferase involved in cell wall biosynthesis